MIEESGKPRQQRSRLGSAGARVPSTGAGLSCATWLSEHLLILVCWFDDDGAGEVQASILSGGAPIPVEVRSLSYRPLLATGLEAPSGKVVIGSFSGQKAFRERPFAMTVRCGEATLLLGPTAIAGALTDLKTLLRGDLAGLDPETRADLLDVITSAAAWHGQREGGFSLSKKLFLVREALRERLPYCVVTKDEPQGLHLDAILAIDESAFWIKGWVRDEDAAITRLTLFSPEGSRAELLQHAFRHPRPDVEEFYGCSGLKSSEKSGFIGYCELPVPSRLQTGWIAEMRNALGIGVEVEGPPVVRDALRVRNTILGDLAQERPSSNGLVLHHVYPALTRFQEQWRGTVEVESIVQHGTLNAAPEASIIVPLYKRIDFLEHQLAQFAHDPEIARADLIYILDSPELAESLGRVAAQLYGLYRIPFRVVVLKRNAGFSGANNVGASLANGRLLLFYNSDVLPDRPGWLGTMTAFYHATPGIGALGPKLLYEDDSLQHAGMYFYRAPGSAVWENVHYFKGLHRLFPAANVTRPVPCVSGAFLMIDCGLYEELGGLRGMYVQGDYEDSDLCLRLIEAGRQNWYLPDAELYHLEGQSYPSELRKLTTRYNMWLQTHLWNERIEAVMSQAWKPQETAGSHPDRLPSSGQSAPTFFSNTDRDWK